MTPTTPTTALAALDLNKLQAIADRVDARGLFNASCDIREWIASARAALARRAAQPVAPVQDVLTIPTAIMDIACDHRLHDEYKRGHRDARHAAADLVLARADELKALAPSPQIAEVAELPTPWEKRATFLPPMHKPSTPVETAMAAEIAELRAIAASRRAAGGELIDLLRAIRPNYGAVGSRDVDVTAQRARIDRAIELLSAAPASAGQAAPADHKEMVELIVAVMDQFGFMDGANEHRTEELREALESALAAQPAEGAGQAGQVAIQRDLAQRCLSSMRAAVTFGETGQGRPPAQTCMFEIEELEAVLAAPTERAAAPAEQPDDWQAAIAEVERATLKFPTWPTDPLHAVAVLGEEFGELTKAVLQTTYEPHKVQPGELRTEAIQTAAMSLRFLASLGRYEFARSPQHEQGSTHQPSAQKGGEA